MTDTTEDKLANAREQAMAQYSNIVDLVTRLRASEDDDTYHEMAKELAEEAGFTVTQDIDRWHWHNGKDHARGDDCAEEEDAWITCCEDNSLRPDRDQAEQAIHESPLSVETRSGWTMPNEKMEPEEFRILLCTGGPAVQIRGELDQHGEPSRAWLECQDWFTPWTQVFDVEQETLLAYARCFYFGEGT